MDVTIGTQEPQLFRLHLRQRLEERTDSQIGIVFTLGIADNDASCAGHEPRGQRVCKFQFPLRRRPRQIELALQPKRQERVGAGRRRPCRIVHPHDPEAVKNQAGSLEQAEDLNRCRVGLGLELPG